MLMFDGRRDALSIGLRIAVVVLTLSTAYIHYTLGGLLFLANAVGYLVLAAAMVAPLGIASRYRWLIRAALIVFTLATIGGWMMFGARIFLGYLDKGIELVLIAVLFVEMMRYDGGPIAVAQRGWELATSILRKLTGRSAA
ncbi:MAG: hypothetical protein ABI725_08990 [Chloroflexota bacterium]